MRFNIEWNCFLRVATAQKGEKLLGKIAETLDLELSHIEMQHYWKDDALFRVSARSCLEAATTKDALYSLLMNVGKLATRWLITPSLEESAWELGGSAGTADIRLPGVDSMSFTMSQEQEQQIEVHSSLPKENRLPRPVII